MRHLPRAHAKPAQRSLGELSRLDARCFRFLHSRLRHELAKDFGIRRAPAHRQNDEETRQIWVRELAELSEWPQIDAREY